MSLPYNDFNFLTAICKGISISDALLAKESLSCESTTGKSICDLIPNSISVDIVSNNLSTDCLLIPGILEIGSSIPSPATIK